MLLAFLVVIFVASLITVGTNYAGLKKIEMAPKAVIFEFLKGAVKNK